MHKTPDKSSEVGRYPMKLHLLEANLGSYQTSTMEPDFENT